MLIGYARVSTNDQETATQVAALKAAGCERTYREKASGGRWDRPELHPLLDQIRKEDVLVVWKLDRLSRSVRDVLAIMDRLSEAGAGFRSLTEAGDHMRSRNDEHPLPSGSAREPKGKLRPTLPRRVAIGYARVAAVSQRAPRAGLDAQVAKIQARARAEGITCVEVIEDSGESALNLKRPGLKRLFRALDAGPISVVITADLSRLARDMSDLRRLLSRFARRGVSLITVEESHVLKLDRSPLSCQGGLNTRPRI